MAEAFLARAFPKKHQLVTAVFASYIGAYGLIKIGLGNPEPAAPVKEVKVKKSKTPTATGGYVAPTADNIGTWLDNPNNITAWEKTLQ